MSLFSAVELAPRDPILGLNEAFNADTRATKVNLGVGVYTNEEGKIPLLRAVREEHAGDHHAVTGIWASSASQRTASWSPVKNRPPLP